MVDPVLAAKSVTEIRKDGGVMPVPKESFTQARHFKTYLELAAPTK